MVTNPGGRSATLAGGFTYVPLAITSISPQLGFAGSVVRVTGTGFLTGALVTFDGIPANTTSATVTVITVTAPAHAWGAVDVVVTNPDGQRGSLARGFTYTPTPTLTVASTEVTSGQDLIVSWEMPERSSPLDWIGLFRVGAANEDYLDFFWAYTGGSKSGTLRFQAPSQPGQYEFRYLLNDGYTDVSRSQTVTVSALRASHSHPAKHLAPSVLLADSVYRSRRAVSWAEGHATQIPYSKSWHAPVADSRPDGLQ